MRGNGLQAERYVAVADLDPRTADVLLAELRDRGVAAYAADSPDPGPSGAVDRLYVDATAEQQVRSMIDDQLGAHDAAAGQPDATDDAAFFDAAFADIVAGFHQTPTPAAGAWSASEDVEPAARTDRGNDSDAPADGQPPGGVDASAQRSYTGWDDLLRPEPPARDPLPDPEDRYVPPPPPPLPRVDLRTRIAWAAVLGGPGVLFAAVIFGFQLSSLQLLLAAVAFLGGFVALVARLKDRDDDDGGDDGAVV